MAKLRENNAPVEEYSVRKQREAQQYLYDKASSVPVVIPVGQKIPETQNQAIQRILLASGAITREQFESALGIFYDGDFGEDDEIDIPSSVDEDFEQSRFASYIDAEVSAKSSRLEVPNVETKSTDIASAPNTPEASPQNSAQEASEQGGD